MNEQPVDHIAAGLTAGLLQLVVNALSRRGTELAADLAAMFRAGCVWNPPIIGGQYESAYMHSLRRVADSGVVLSIPGHGSLLQGADAVAASATAGQITARTKRMTAMLVRGPVTFFDLERYAYPPVGHDVIPWACSVAVHRSEALQSGLGRPAARGFRLTGPPG